MKTYLLRIENENEAWLRFNVETPYKTFKEFNECEEILNSWPEYLREDDWVYFGKDGNLHLIDDEPIIKIKEKAAKDGASNNSFGMLGMCAAIQSYMREPRLLYGEEEIEYLKKKGRI